MDATRYADLWAPESFWDRLKNDPASLKKICNGVGSETSWTYHLTPNTIWGLDVTPASDIHDFMYFYPITFDSDEEGLAWKDKADRVFLNNMIRLFEKAESESWWARRFSTMRRNRAQLYFKAVQNFGGTSFWEGKNRLTELGK
jgi:hypothetical protein